MMEPKRVKMALANFITAVEGCGMPVAFLRDVHQNYGLDWGGADGDFVRPTFVDTLYLSTNTLSSVKNIDPGLPYGEATGVQTIYHEATHAWLDLHEDDREVETLLNNSTRHYTGAPLKDGTKASDPNRIAQEAAAEYVGHRAATWWSALAGLTAAGSIMKEKSDADGRAAVGEFVRDQEKTYDRAMTARVFGYQDKGVFTTRQVETKKPIPNALREFCNRVLLESKIPELMSHVDSLSRTANKLLIEAGQSPRR